MTSPGSKSRIKWEGDSNKEIRSWPADIRQDYGGELQRLEEGKKPLHSKSMGDVLPGVREILNEDKDFWYRLMFWLNEGWIYVLNCFKKDTNKTSKGDIQKAKERLAKVKARNDPPAEQEDEKEEKSA